MNIKEKLKQWGFQELTRGFIENGVTLDVLKICSMEEISSLLTPLNLGSKIIFKRKLEEFQNGLILVEVSAEEPLDVVDVILPSTSREDHSLHTTSTSEEIYETPIDVQSSATATCPQMSHILSSKRIFNMLEGTESPKQKVMKALNNDELFYEEFEKHLKETGFGRSIISFYEKTGHLDKSNRNKLSKLILSFELGDNLDKVITKERFLQLRDAIVKIFPTESKETWFIPYQNKGKNRKTNAKGKLVDLYHNTRKNLIKNGVITRRGHVTSDDGDDTDESACNSKSSGSVEKSAPLLRENTDSILETDNMEDDVDVEELSSNDNTPTNVTNASLLPPSRHSRRKGKRQLDSLTEFHSVTGEKTRDELDVFGEYMVSQLRKCSDSHRLAVAKHRVYQVLFDMETSNLSKQNNQNSTSRLVDSTTSGNVSSEDSNSNNCQSVEDDNLCDIIKKEKN